VKIFIVLRTFRIDACVNYGLRLLIAWVRLHLLSLLEKGISNVGVFDGFHVAQKVPHLSTFEYFGGCELLRLDDADIINLVPLHVVVAKHLLDLLEVKGPPRHNFDKASYSFIFHEASVEQE